MALSDSQSNEVTFLSGFAADGTLAPTTFATWNGNTGTPTYGDFSSQAKWGGETASSAGGSISYFFGNGVTTQQQAMFKAGLQLWQNEVNASFVQAASSSAANFTFEVNSNGKAFYTSGDPSNPVGSKTAGSPGSVPDGAGGTRNPYISIDVNNTGFGKYDGTFNDGGNAFDTIVHEEGHMLGLGHAGPYNEGTSPTGTGSTSGSSQLTAYDTHQYSIMSYNTANDKSTAKYDPNVDTAMLNGNQPSTPQSLDILAAQRLYGAATGGELTKAQTFGFNCTVADSSKVFFDFSNYNTAGGIAPVATIYDSAAAGSTLDLSGFSANSRVDLNQGGFTSCGGLTNNVSIAYGTRVDTAVGGAGDDTFVVNADNDLIDGGAGSNTAVFNKAMANYAITPNVDGSTTVLDKSTGATTRLTNVKTASFADQSTPVCFCTGSRIRTLRDGVETDVAVEALAIGDTVVTAAGAHRLIRWIGHRSYADRFVRNNPALLPVRFHAGSLADGVPVRDLLVSPKHAMFLDGVLIPAEHLVNSVTITRETAVRDLAYWHVELDSHDVLIAEEAASESFVDDNGRDIFHNAHTFRALYPEARAAEAVYCAPRVEHGHALHRVRRRLAQRAGLSVPAARDPGALRGYVDACVADGRGGVRLRGWALSLAHPDAPVCLEVVADGRVVALLSAELFRPDLVAAGLGDGHHGFDEVLALPQAGAAGACVTLRRAVDGVVLTRDLAIAREAVAA